MKFKSEARNAKFETNPNDQNSKREKRSVLNISFLNLNLFRISRFEFRI